MNRSTRSRTSRSKRAMGSVCSTKVRLSRCQESDPHSRDVRRRRRSIIPSARIPPFWMPSKASVLQLQPRLRSLPEVYCSDHERSTPQVLDPLVESERRGPGHHLSTLGAAVLRADLTYFDLRRDFWEPRLTRCILALAETPSSDLLTQDRRLASRSPVPTRLFSRSALVLEVGCRRTL